VGDGGWILLHGRRIFNIGYRLFGLVPINSSLSAVDTTNNAESLLFLSITFLNHQEINSILDIFYILIRDIEDAKFTKGRGFVEVGVPALVTLDDARSRVKVSGATQALF